jgi:hypothetical protein
MREDPTYPRRFKEAERQAARVLEDEAVRLAVYGVKKPVLYQGKQVYVDGVPLYETTNLSPGTNGEFMRFVFIGDIVAVR